MPDAERRAMHPLRIAFLTATFLAANAVAARAALDLDRRVLAVAASYPLLRPACVRVAFSLRGAPERAKTADASLEALETFVRSHRSDATRAWCLRNARNIAATAPPSPYVRPLEALEEALLRSHRTSDRIAGALAAWGDWSARPAPLLLRLAEPGRARAVRVAALTNLYWPMLADIHAGTPVLAYDRTISRALDDSDDRIVVAGLAAYAGLHEAAADPALIAYARNRDPVVRAGAIEALRDRTVITAANGTLFERGLRDADVRVREAALDTLLFATADRRRLLAAFARSAPTTSERRAARAQLAALSNERRPKASP